ncbi:MAG TPA: GGDEF domain-containing protein [Leptolyngbyaceae cyanobacterium]
MKIIQYLDNQPKAFVLILASLLLILISLINYFVLPTDIYTSIFYLIPILISTWYGGDKFGVFMCFMSALAWVISRENHLAYSSPSINYWNASVILGFFLTVTYLLSELKNALERERKLVRTDALTGVANRQVFNELAAMEIKKSRRYGHPFTVAYIDIDDFKNINHYGGHQIGNAVLQAVAQSIKNSLRETDIVARICGDEFAVVLPGISYETAQTVVGRVHKQLLEKMDENKWPATFSIGAITFLNPPDSVDEIIEKTDYLIYCIKNDGKNRLEHIIEEGSF